MFWDENKFLVSRLGDSNWFNSEENNLLRIKGDLTEGVKGGMIIA